MKNEKRKFHLKYEAETIEHHVFLFNIKPGKGKKFRKIGFFWKLKIEKLN